MIVCSYNNVIAVAVQLWPFLGLIILCACAEATITASSIETRASWKEHLPLEVEEHKLAGLAGLGDVARFNETLSHILVPRVVGTTGHAAVNQFIQEKMRSLNWHVSTDRFDAVTPNLGNLVFENIIATLNPSAERFVILACHYDSKYFKDNVFFGASDSAVPCAMLIDLAETLDNHLKSVRDQNQLSMQLVFFDGEEAFREWTATDSLYGSRHLAQRWQNESRLEQIDMLILLDLLGMPDPQFFSFFANTEQWHDRCVDIEQRLTYLDLMVRDGHSGVLPQHANAYFKQQSFIDAQIDDDHMPFLQRGVPILHLIPVPFPDEWHKFSDNWHAIDFVTVENLCRILRVFVIEYLNIKL